MVKAKGGVGGFHRDLARREVDDVDLGVGVLVPGEEVLDVSPQRRVDELVVERVRKDDDPGLGNRERVDVVDLEKRRRKTIIGK